MIQNFESLATTPLRRQLLRIVESALEALDAKTAVAKKLQLKNNGRILSVEGVDYSLDNGGKVLLIGFGKVALEGAKAVYEILQGKIKCGFVLDVREGEVGSGIVCKVGTHPLPTTVNVAATEELIQMLTGLSEKDLVICIASGGGSSLLCSPYSSSCDVQSRLERELTKCGANIEELNTVRKHLSKVKGGQLGLLCRPARVVTLVFSDVPHGGMELVASGPTMLDTSTIQDAKNVLDKYRILEKVNLPKLELNETPKDPASFEHVQNVLAVSAKQALEGAQKKAEALGFKVRVLPDSFVGEAREIGKRFAQNVETNECLIAAGESTVNLESADESAFGGRNMELALSAGLYLPENSALVALASDGFDNTPFAGGIVDSNLRNDELQSRKAKEALNSHNTYNYFQNSGDGLITGKTGMNVADLVIAIKE